MSLTLWLIALLGACCEEMAPLSDAQNYDFSSNITSEAQVVAPGDATVDWAGLGVDLLGRQIDPATQVDTIQVVRYEKTLEEVLGAINEDELPMSWVDGYVEYANDGDATSAPISDFDFLGTPIDPDVEIYEGPIYLVNASETDVIGYRGLGFFSVDPTSSNSTIYLDSDSATLDYTVDLEIADRIEVCKSDSYYVDWTGLTTDGRGKEIRLADLDELMLAWYEEDLSALEADFLLLEELAETMYKADISGLAGYELYDMTSEDGEAFDGFTKDGSWVLALRCTTCTNPAPPFLGIVER